MMKDRFTIIEDVLNKMVVQIGELKIEAWMLKGGPPENPEKCCGKPMLLVSDAWGRYMGHQFCEECERIWPEGEME